ncbi:coiled-coil domain-containing protein 172 [Grus japonensis]|uniref:Coiled-coil domain-containing protein 172 n=1 Tax=Grus japonensis TaxID=30415 RepID=A0ABC9X362_GRUJA
MPISSKTDPPLAKAKPISNGAKFDINRSYEKINQIKEELSTAKMKRLETKTDAQRKLSEEEDNFTREVTEFNNEYGLTSNRDLLIKKKVKTEINDLENEATLLKNDLEKVTREAERMTKDLEAEKLQVTEKPQTDPECLRLKKELENCKDDDWESICETLRTEIEILQMALTAGHITSSLEDFENRWLPNLTRLADGKVQRATASLRLDTESV